MPVLAAVNIAAAPGNRIGGFLSTHAINSSSRWRSLERSRSSNCHPVRQVSIRNAITPAIRSGNQPPSTSYVRGNEDQFESKEKPVHRCDQERVVTPFQRNEGREHRRNRHQ